MWVIERDKEPEVVSHSAWTQIFVSVDWSQEVVKGNRNTVQYFCKRKIRHLINSHMKRLSGERGFFRPVVNWYGYLEEREIYHLVYQQQLDIFTTQTDPVMWQWNNISYHADTRQELQSVFTLKRDVISVMVAWLLVPDGLVFVYFRNFWSLGVFTNISLSQNKLEKKIKIHPVLIRWKRYANVCKKLRRLKENRLTCSRWAKRLRSSTSHSLRPWCGEKHPSWPSVRGRQAIKNTSPGLFSAHQEAWVTYWMLPHSV